MTSLSTGFSADDLIVDRTGNVYGTAHGKLFEIQQGTHQVITLAKRGVVSALAVDPTGNLYAAEYGAIRRIAAGTHEFSTITIVEGSQEYARTLLLDAAGDVYGITSSGVVFEVPIGTHSLSGLGTNFKYVNDLIVDSMGNLDGWEQTGQAVLQITAGSHAIRELTPVDDVESTPGNLVMDASSNLYAVTRGGEVFEVIAGRDDLHAFKFVADAPIGKNLEGQVGGLVMDAAGDIFGISTNAGPFGFGAVFEVHAGTNAVTTPVVFNGRNGSFPLTRLVADAAGTLYIATANHNSAGVVPDPAMAKGSVLAIAGAGFVAASSSGPTIIQQPTDTPSAENKSVTFNSNAGGYPNPTVQWQQSTDGGQTFSDITTNASATTTTLALSGLALSQSGTLYRAVFTNSLGTVTTTAATLTVLPPLSLVTPAHASSAVVAGASVALGARGADPTGQSHLTYTWSVVKAPAGAKPVSFTRNATGSAKKTTVTFRKAGNYTLRCTISDGTIRTLTTDTSIIVKQTATRLRISPRTFIIKPSQTAVVHAVVYDQFGTPLRTDPSIRYSTVHSLGSIDPATGLFTASIWPGPVFIEARGDSLSSIIEGRVTSD